MDSEDMVRLLRHALSSLPGEVRESVAAAILAEMERHRRQASGSLQDAISFKRVDKAFGQSDSFYAIKDADLAVVSDCGMVAATVWGIVKSPVAIIAGLVALLYRYRRHRVALSGEQAVVLLTLRQHSVQYGLTVEELIELLPLRVKPSAGEIEAVLRSLASAETASGEPKPLVRVRDGEWRPVGV